MLIVPAAIELLPWRLVRLAPLPTKFVPMIEWPLIYEPLARIEFEKVSKPADGWIEFAALPAPIVSDVSNATARVSLLVSALLN